MSKLPRTGLEHRVFGERARARTAFDLLTSHVAALRGLFADSLPTIGTRQALVSAAARLSDILARLEVMVDIEEPDIRELETLAPPDTPNPEAWASARALNVPVETIGHGPEYALDQAVRGDYDVTWYQAAAALARLERYRAALEAIARQKIGADAGFAIHTAREALNAETGPR